MYYGFIVYSLRSQPAVLRHCYISGEYEDDTVMAREQRCADDATQRDKARRSGHCKRAGGCACPYNPADIRIRSCTTIPTSLLDTIRAAALVIPCDKIPAAIGVLAALAAHEGGS